MPGLMQPERKLTWSEDGRLVRAEVKSLFSGRWNAMETDSPLAVTQEQWDAWQGGMHIQLAMPQLGDAEREFLMSGATPQEWDELFKEDKE